MKKPVNATIKMVALKICKFPQEIVMGSSKREDLHRKKSEKYSSELLDKFHEDFLNKLLKGVLRD